MGDIRQTGWNYVDQLIYTFETLLKGKAKYATSHKEDEIDVETMIAAETDYLRTENDKLKQIMYPGRIICSEGKYYCPHCKFEISSLIAREIIEGNKIKHCNECGKRIILSVPYKYATSHKAQNEN